jgi:recombination protein RecA
MSAFSTNLLRSQIEARLPSAFVAFRRPEYKTIPTGIQRIDDLNGGIPISALTEICGSNVASSGKTSVLVSLLSSASQNHFCALVDASDTFDPAPAAATGMNLSRLLWVRCGKNKSKLKPLEQAFKATDILLQSGGFGLIVVDLGGVAERFVRSIPLSSWFRLSRVVEKQSTALVFIGQQPHATSCAGLVLHMTADPATFSGRVMTAFNLRAEIMRTREKKPSQSVPEHFSLKTLWA